MRSASRSLVEVVLGVAVWVVAAPACGSSNENPGPPASCADAGLECAACCTELAGDLAAIAFAKATDKCTCDTAPPTVCAAECAELCTSRTMSGECLVCLRTAAANCLNNHCTDADCEKYRACLLGC